MNGDGVTSLFFHIVSVLFSAAYRGHNATALRQDWPRIPLPASKTTLLQSADLGRVLADLLDLDAPIRGVTVGKLRPELSSIGPISREGGGSLNPEAGDLDVTVGWGHSGKGGAVMPGKGKIVERDYTAKEREAIAGGAAQLDLSEEQALALLGERTFDVYLNGLAYWKNIPARVWEYTIGGYQVIKKWLSYREREILGRALRMDEARTVRDIARRIAAILLLEPKLDANYQAVKAATCNLKTEQSSGF
ncbi:MAG: type ISP restriction/modification enzyme [Candidatus Binataceae bacterium]